MDLNKMQGENTNDASLNKICSLLLYGLQARDINHRHPFCLSVLQMPPF